MKKYIYGTIYQYCEGEITLKHYIIQNVYELPVAYNEWYLVKANSKKEALNKFFLVHGGDFKKKDFKVHTLEEFYDGEEIVVIH